MRKNNRDTVDADVPLTGVEKVERVELGLALLETVAKPNQELTCHDIAAWCGCTDNAIYLIERKALKKLHKRVRFGDLMERL